MAFPQSAGHICSSIWRKSRQRIPTNRRMLFITEHWPMRAAVLAADSVTWPFFFVLALDLQIGTGTERAVIQSAPFHSAFSLYWFSIVLQLQI